MLYFYSQYGTVLTLRGNHPLLMKDHLCDEVMHSGAVCACS